MVSIKLSGFDELRERLSKAGTTIKQEVDAELNVAAHEIEEGAVREAPADQGIIRAEIRTDKIGDMNYGVFSNALYSGYLEFGTRTKVQIPPGLEEIASQIGSFESSLSAKEAIFAWCERQGIQKDLWYPIFISIMTKGINPHPFFFKQLERVQPELIKRIENILKSL